MRASPFNTEGGKKMENFECPICHSHEYEHTPGGDYAQISTTRYTCKGCSVLFMDPAKFTATKFPPKSAEKGD